MELVAAHKTRKHSDHFFEILGVRRFLVALVPILYADLAQLQCNGGGCAMLGLGPWDGT
jgi:hypothetical protein